MSYLALFRMPTAMTITGRSSSITNAFINAIIPIVPPTEEQVAQALSHLGMTPESFECAFCGGVASEWDHLRPLVRDKLPTGYISEIHNLVPSCGKCNQSKGNKEWKTWITGKAPQSPTGRGVKNVAERIQRLEAFEAWSRPTKLDFESVAGSNEWAMHWENWKQVLALMQKSQALAAKISAKVAREYKSH